MMRCLLLLLVLLAVASVLLLVRFQQPPPPPPPPKSIRILEGGIASYYSLPEHGRRTASGERFDMHSFTAAHPTLPFGTQVQVRRLDNFAVVSVRINDRLPRKWAKRGRIIDLSYAAAAELGMLDDGLVAVQLEAVQ